MTAQQVEKIPFFIGNAFTTDPYGGNPAAVVFLPKELPDETLFRITKNFNQPVTTFLYPSLVPDEEGSTTATFRIRWFTVATEILICGHGSIVAANTIFSTPGVVSENVQALRLQGTANTVSARKVDGQLEIVLAAKDVERLPADDEEKIGGVVKRALGDIKILSVWTDKKFVIFEVEEKEAGDLGSRKVDTKIMEETGYPSNIITARSSDPNVAFISRVFHPLKGVDEDPVCGAAHSVLVPFWSKQLGFGEDPVAAMQVSPRGGGLGVQWDKSTETVTLRGSSRLTMSGHMYI